MMLKAHGIISKGTTGKYADAIAKLHAPGDYVLVVRGVPRMIVMTCPDGCGEILTINLDRRAGKAWRRYEGKGKLTIYPSVWRDTGCRAHFIVWNDRILWCNATDSYGVHANSALLVDVLRNLPTDSFVRVELIADSLQATPWEVLWACKDLVRRGQAQEGDKGTYRRIGNVEQTQERRGRIDIVT